MARLRRAKGWNLFLDSREEGGRPQLCIPKNLSSRTIYVFRKTQDECSLAGPWIVIL